MGWQVEVSSPKWEKWIEIKREPDMSNIGWHPRKYDAIKDESYIPTFKTRQEARDWINSFENPYWHFTAKKVEA